MLSLLALPFLAGANAQVTATGTNGVTNPPAPSFMPVGSYVNQSSYSRLTTINGVDDFCLYGPPEPGPDSLIGNVRDFLLVFSLIPPTILRSDGTDTTQVEPIVVAYCTKPRNEARIIPDGTIQSAHVSVAPPAKLSLVVIPNSLLTASLFVHPSTSRSGVCGTVLVSTL
jgi:hypothetical protein